MSRLIRNFCETIGLLSRGEFSRECDAKLRELVEAMESMQADSGTGKITVEIAFKYELGRIDIAPSVKLKLPETKRFMKTPFWAIDGALSVEHPSQADMFPVRRVRTEDGRERADDDSEIHDVG